MDLQLKLECKNYKPTKHCDSISIDDNRTVKASIKTEPLDYSTVARTDSKQVKNEHSIDNSTEEESDADFVKPYIISIRYKKSLKDVACDNKSIKRKKSSQASALSQDSNMDLDIEDQLSTLTDLSVTTTCHKDTCDVVCPGEVYQCNECNFKSSQKHVLRKHIKSHSSKKPYRCSKCKYQSVTMRSLQKHLITHMPEKPYKCPKCSYSGSRKLYLDVHMRTHVVNSSYKCNACEYTASQRSTLTKHFNVEHLFLPG